MIQQRHMQRHMNRTLEIFTWVILKHLRQQRSNHQHTFQTPNMSQCHKTGVMTALEMREKSSHCSHLLLSSSSFFRLQWGFKRRKTPHLHTHTHPLHYTGLCAALTCSDRRARCHSRDTWPGRPALRWRSGRLGPGRSCSCRCLCRADTATPVQGDTHQSGLTNTTNTIGSHRKEKQAMGISPG